MSSYEICAVYALVLAHDGRRRKLYPNSVRGRGIKLCCGPVRWWRGDGRVRNKEKRRARRAGVGVHRHVPIRVQTYILSIDPLKQQCPHYPEKTSVELFLQY